MAFEELKQRQSAIWGSAPWERVAETFADLHDDLIARLGPRPGERWLDLAAGTGAVAVRAARAGAEVTALDLAPALIDTAKRASPPNRCFRSASTSATARTCPTATRASTSWRQR